MFIIIYAATTRSEKKNIFNLKTFKKLLKYKNVFFKKKIEILSIFKQKNHVIKIENNKKPLYKLLYNLFQMKLSKLRRYLKNILYKD